MLDKSIMQSTKWSLPLLGLSRSMLTSRQTLLNVCLMCALEKHKHTHTKPTKWRSKFNDEQINGELYACSANLIAFHFRLSPLTTIERNCFFGKSILIYLFTYIHYVWFWGHIHFSSIEPIIYCRSKLKSLHYHQFLLGPLSNWLPI